MAMIEEGKRVTVMAGRRAGEEVEITKVLDDNFVLVKGRKERKVSIKHLRPLEE
jgi:ribosomal protein L14E/L6E/L27E